MIFGMFLVFCLLGAIIGGILGIVGWRMDHVIVRRVGLTLFLLFSTPVLLYIGQVVADETYHSNPSNNFKDVFDVAPPSEVTQLQSEVGGYWDSSNLYLKFHTPSSSLNRLVQGRWKRVSDPATISEWQNASSHHTPIWWTPPFSNTSVLYAPTDKERLFAYERTFLLYDAPRQTAYYCFEGVD